MNMYQCVSVSLVLLKGSWQSWKLKDGGEQPSEGVQWSPGMCSVGSPWKQGWGWGSSQENVCRGSSNTFQTCARALHVLLSSHSSPRMPLEQCLTLCKAEWESLWMRAVPVFPRGALERREAPSSTFYRCPTVLLITHALCWHRKGLLVRGNKLKWGRKWGNQQILILKVDWR